MKYAGEDKPPNFEITMKPLSDDTAPSDHLSQSIILTGVIPPNSVLLERALDTVSSSVASAGNSLSDVTNGMLLHQRLSKTIHKST